MFYFPAVFFFLIAFILKGTPAKVVAVILAIITLGSDIASGWWAADLYTASFILLIFVLNPLFIERWNHYAKKTLATTPKPTPVQIKHYRIMVFIMACSFIFPVLGFYSMCYPDYTNDLIMACGLLAFTLSMAYYLIAVRGTEPVTATNNRDKSLGTVFIAIFATWPLGYIASMLASNNFVVPAIVMGVLCCLSIAVLRGNIRYLAAGSIVLITDYCWRLSNMFLYAPKIFPQAVIIQIIMGVIILAALIWMLKKPSMKSFAVMVAVIISRYLAVLYHLLTYLAAHLTTVQLVQVNIFMVGWMLIAPIALFWIGLRLIKTK